MLQLFEECEEFYCTYKERSVSNMFHRKSWPIKIAAALCAAAALLPAAAQAKQLTVLYIPLDNRPVCSAYVQQTMEAAGCKIILPPEKYIAANDRSGDPEGIWNWLQTKAPKADAAVISTDSLLYGGLVASRTHSISKEQLDQRLQHLYALKNMLPIKLYAFSTIMRTPRASQGNVEPPYYSAVGPSIFAYSQLWDKSEQNKLTPAEQLQKQALERNLRKDELGDWLERRRKNLQINTELTHMARNGKFHYLSIGKDDNAPLSATHLEARQLSLSTFDMKPEDFQIIDGVDQLGLLLLVRAYNEAHAAQPTIYPLYSPGAGSATLPQYSDARLQDSVPQQIIAVGAIQAPTPQAADLILALNTPQDGIVKDSTAGDNQFFSSPANRNFAAAIAKQLDAGKQVSLADVSYSNGADNGFISLLAQSDTLERLSAYNGWNTADNAVGYAIAQGIMAQAMPQPKRNLLLRQRIIDDWFYQSNARSYISNELSRHSREDLKYDLGTAEKSILNYINKECNALAQKYNVTKGSQFKLTFPWRRLFEVNVEMKK